MEKLKSFLFSNISPRQTVIKNTIWMWISEIFSRGFKVLVYLYVIRMLGPEKFGIWEYLLSFVGVFFILADFGVSNIFIRDYQSDENKEKHLSTYFLIKVSLSVIFALIALFGFFGSKKYQSFLVYVLMIIFYALMNVENFFENYFIAVQKVEKRFIFNFLSAIILFLSVVIGVFLYKDISVLVVSYLISVIFGIIVAFIFFNQEAKLKLIFDISLIKKYLFNGFPLVIFGLLGYLLFNIDKIILTHMRPIEEVGYYSAVTRILGVLLAIPSLFNTALYPYLAKLVLKVKEEKVFFKNLVTLFKLIIFFSVIVAFIISLIFYFLAQFFISFLFGDQYLPAVPILKSFIWMIILVFPTTFLDFFLISNNKQWLDFIITLIPTVLNIFLNLAFIPKFGVFGAIYSSLLAQFLNLVLTLITSTIILIKIKKSYLKQW